MILLDTSGLLAALFADQRRHRECAEVLARSEAPRLLSPFVLAELDYHILKYAGVETELLLLNEVAQGTYQLESFDETDVAEAQKVIAKYERLRIGLADASIVVLAEKYGTRDILTLDDRHFSALKAGRSAFRVLPRDA